MCENIQWANMQHVLEKMEVWLSRRKDTRTRVFEAVSLTIPSNADYKPTTILQSPPSNKQFLLVPLGCLSRQLCWSWLGLAGWFVWSQLNISQVQGDISMYGGQLACSWNRIFLAGMTRLTHLYSKSLIIQQASTDVLMVRKKVRMRISLIAQLLSSLC